MDAPTEEAKTSETEEEFPLVTRLPDAELRQLAIDIHEGKVFGSWNLPPHDNDLLPSIFMVLCFMQRKPPANAGHVFEYLYKSQGGINGYPSFFSLRWLAEEDVKPLWAMLQELRAAKELFAAAGTLRS